MKVSQPLRVYVDHGEAYGNLGDEAMLLNGLRRLIEYVGPCEFIVPAEEGKPLPDLSRYKVKLISPPHLVFRSWQHPIAVILLLLAQVPGLRPWLRDTNGSRVWRWIAAILNIMITLHRMHFWPWTGKTLRAFIKALRHCDAFYGIGAADFNDGNLSGFIYKCWLYKTVRPWVKVSAVSAQGIGPLETPWARNLMKNAFKYVDILSFRDFRYSYEMVTSLNPKCMRSAIVGDESFSLPVPSRLEVNKFLHDIGVNPCEPFIAFHWRMTDYTQDTTPLIPCIASILDSLCDSLPYALIFFPMSYHAHSTFDEMCGWAIRGAMKHPDRMKVVPLCKDVHLIKGAVGAARYSLGLGYHIHVFSLSQGHPALILYSGEYYRYKSEGLISFYGQPNAAKDIEKTSCEDVVRAVMLIESRYDETCSSIQKVNERISAVNDWTIKEMTDLLGKDCDHETPP